MSMRRSTDNLYTSEDDAFDQRYPLKIERLSPRHWTPVQVARKAASWLVERRGTRVLDIGCGPGKFCAVAALATEGAFTGVEQRPHLARLAREMIASRGIPRVSIIEGNIVGIPFSDYDAFYLYNPFQENILPSLKIDGTVDTTPELYQDYTGYVASQLAQAPLGTRIVTYVCQCHEIPDCYDCEREAYGDFLKLWVKNREAEPASIDQRPNDY